MLAVNNIGFTSWQDLALGRVLIGGCLHTPGGTGSWAAENAATLERICGATWGGLDNATVGARFWIVDVRRVRDA